MINKLQRSRIDSCRICKGKEFIEILKLENMPLTDEFIPEKEFGKEYLQDIEIAVCKECGSTQNLYDTDMSDYYNDYTYSVQSSGFAVDFMRTLASQVKSKYFNEKENLKVIEIGSGTGEQLLEFKKIGFNVLGIEPSDQLSKYANSNGIETINAFFDNNALEILNDDFKKVDVVIASYTFDHVPLPVEVLKSIRYILKDDGILVIEVHDLDVIEKRNEFCLFEHEHYTYLNHETITALLEKNEFSILTFDLLDIKKRRANSLLVVAQKSNIDNFYAVDINNQINKLKNLNLEIKNAIDRIDNWLLKNKDSAIVAYGAGGRGVMTLAALKNLNMVKYIVDKNPKSKNIFAPKSHIPVFDIEELGNNRADKILVFSFGYYDEIVKEIGDKFGYSPEQFISLLNLLKA